MFVLTYGGWIVSKVQSVFWRRVTSLRRGVVSTGGGTFLLEDTSFCGGVCFDLEEGSSASGVGGHTSLGRGAFDLEEGVYITWSRGVVWVPAREGAGTQTSRGGGHTLLLEDQGGVCFDLKEGFRSSEVGGDTLVGRGCI